VTATGGSVLAAGLDIGRSHARILLGTSLENVIGDQELHLPERHTPDETIPKIGEALASMIVASGHALSDLKCVGVGLPGPVDEVAGVVTGGSILPTWVDRPVGAMLRSTLGAQICLENDANLGAYAIAKTVRPAVGTLLYVKVGTGVGAGAIVGGRLLQGSSGLAGEIGHLPSLDGGPQCRCGRRGCLETIASAEAIRAGLSDVLERDLSNEDVVELAREDSGVVRRVVAEAGHALGRGLAAASCMLDPGLIVIGGPLVGLGDLLLEPMRQAFERNALPAIARSTTIVMSSLEQPPEAFGALMLGLKDPGVIRHDRVR
jgi:predicted NBD/HSP70 family sugar kinase